MRLVASTANGAVLAVFPLAEAARVVAEPLYAGVTLGTAAEAYDGQPLPADFAPWDRVGPLPTDGAYVPGSVTRYQLVRALRQTGMKATFDAALASNPEAAEDWSLCTSVSRSFPLVVGFAAATGISEAVLDDLFRLATTFP